MARNAFSLRSPHRRLLVALCIGLPSVVTAVVAGCSGNKDDHVGQRQRIDSGYNYPSRDAGSEGGDGGDAESEAAAARAHDPRVERGQYLVDHVAGCGDCHTPGGSTPDPSKYLAGVECLVDTNEAAGRGCLNSGNLTNDSTGLGRRSDAEIKKMFLDGRRPEGRALDPTMPYWIFHNMTADDADAIVAYLRTVPPVNHIVPPNDFTFLTQKPAAPVDVGSIPKVKGEQDGGLANGRYLSSMVGRCLECHTPDAPGNSIRPIDMKKPFGGGRSFTPKALGLPTPPYPDTLYSPNITPVPVTGIGFWTVADVQRAIKEGRDNNNAVMCLPMPSGPMGAYGGLTDQDALDIASYIMSLPEIDKFAPGNKCVLQE